MRKRRRQTLIGTGSYSWDLPISHGALAVCNRTLRRLSVTAPSRLAWQRVTFYGRYRFDSDLRHVNLSAIADQLRDGAVSLVSRTARCCSGH